MTPAIRVTAKAAIVRDRALLLIEYRCPGDAWHLSLPGGRVAPGEGLNHALERKVLAETCAAIHLGGVLLVVEYVPDDWDGRFGDVPKVQIHMAAQLQPGSEPRMPAHHDPGQVGLRWVALDELRSVPLRPAVAGPLRQALLQEDPVPRLQSSW